MKIRMLCLCLAVASLLPTVGFAAQPNSGATLTAQAQSELKPRFRFSEPAGPARSGDVRGPQRSDQDPPAAAVGEQRNKFILQQAVQNQNQQQNSDETAANEAEGFALGQGDVVGFSMFGQPDMATTAFVSSSGTVSLPLIGEVKIAGLTPVEAQKRVAQAFEQGGFFRDPQVNLTIEQYRSRQVSVLGEVNRPGRYPLETQTTVLDVLALAAGRTATGSHVVTVVRNVNGQTVRHSVDLNNLFTNSGDLGSLNLRAGDIVFVPEAELFYIYGEVRKPDSYALKPGMTIMQAVSVGGGITERGSNSRIELRRKDEQGKIRKFSPELTDTIEANDVIFVKERFF